MIVVDSSVWIDYFNGQVTPQTAFLRTLLRVESLTPAVLVGDLVLCEVLQGKRSEANARKAEHTLRGLALASMSNPNLAIVAAQNNRRLQSDGITIRSTIDMIIGTFCMTEGHSLLHKDNDFEQMRDLGLKVVRVGLSVNEPEPCYASAA